MMIWSKFDIILTNPPFGEDRKFEPKTTNEKILQNYTNFGTQVLVSLLILAYHLENSVRLLNETEDLELF